jgi:hypothetical protein
MDTNRTINMVVMQLALDALKLEESVETAINTAEESSIKINRVKTALREMVINEMMITKFQTLITKPNTQQNGQV